MRKLLRRALRFARRLLRPLLTAISATLAGVAMALLFPIWAVLLILLVIVTHEFAHYLTAHAVGAKAEMPIFVPLGFGVLGITRIRGLNQATRRQVAIAGPIAGMSVALAVALCAVLAGFPAVAVAALCAGGYEAYAATFGSDGRKFRTAA